MEPLLSLMIVIAFILMIATFLAVMIVALLEGQRSQRRQITKLNRDVQKVNSRLMTPSEREARAARERNIEEQNRRARELYEYGGC